MFYEDKIWMAKSGDKKLSLLPKMANRHGLIAGATGTGKTITLKVMAESFSDAGVPVFLADVKGDLAGMCRAGEDTDDMRRRIEKFGLAEAGFEYRAYPTVFWDIFGERGLPLRTTVTEMGPVLLARLMELTDTQADILSIVFKIADDENLLLIDTKDLKSMVAFVAENTKAYSAEYGNMSKASLNVILREIVALEELGADRFFGEPALDIRDWYRTDYRGKGYINILDSKSLINDPRMYATFMLWMLSELFETMPEVGDLDRPKMIFFFDEAHLLFKDMPKALVSKIEQVVKLIRSKGIGVYFITQSPRDIPDAVLGQLGNKIQHGLHAYTPADQKAVKAAAQSFRENPEFDTKEVLQQLGVGEVLVSFLQEDGSPAVVERAKILPPQSRMGTITDAEREAETQSCTLISKYSDMIDRDSAYEFFQRKMISDAEAQRAAEEAAAQAKELEAAAKAAAKERARLEKEMEREAKRQANARKRAVTNVAKSAAGTVGREVGGQLGKSMGGSFGKKLGGNLGASIGRGLLGTLFGR